MRLLKQSAAANVMVFVTSSADHVAGLASATLTITASKDGAAFASISPTVTDRGNGWYNVALTASHTDTLGDLALHVTASGADPTDLLCRVVAGSLDADVSSRLATAGYTAPLDAAGTRAAVGLASANLDTQLATLAAYVDELESRLSSARAGLLDNLAALDAAVSTRLASAGYTAPDNAGVAAIKAKTDSLAFTVAGQVDANVRSMNDAEVLGAGTSADKWRGA